MLRALDGLQTANRLQQLRQQYDAAFRKLAKARQGKGGTDELHQLEAEVRLYRDCLADVLLKGSERKIDEPSRVREAAYYIWLNAGQPHGTSLCDWMDARKQVRA